MWPIFKTRMLIYLVKVNLDVNSLFGKCTHLLDEEGRKIVIRGLMGTEISRSILAHSYLPLKYNFNAIFCFRNRVQMSVASRIWTRIES